MKTKNILWILIVGFIGWIGCNDDNKTLTPSGVEEYELVIPQGNHEYDARIVDWFDRTGVYISSIRLMFILKYKRAGKRCIWTR